MAPEPVTVWGIDIGSTTIEVVVAEIENAAMHELSVLAEPRLLVLIETVDREARPWCQA
jgi:cell division ATPase FtsA